MTHAKRHKTFRTGRPSFATVSKHAFFSERVHIVDRCLGQRPILAMDHQALSISLELLLHELPDPDQDLAVQQFDNIQFAVFPRFPLELRRMIWTRALPKPRRVCLYVCQRHYQQPNSRPLPATLHANQESRQVTLENYVLTLFPLQSSMNDRLTEGVGKSDNRGQEFGASGEKIKFEIRTQSILKLASKYDNCMPFGRMVSCFDPVRDKCTSTFAHRLTRDSRTKWLSCSLLLLKCSIKCRDGD